MNCINNHDQLLLDNINRVIMYPFYKYRNKIENLEAGINQLGENYDFIETQLLDIEDPMLAAKIAIYYKRKFETSQDQINMQIDIMNKSIDDLKHSLRPIATRLAHLSGNEVSYSEKTTDIPLYVNEGDLYTVWKNYVKNK